MKVVPECPQFSNLRLTPTCQTPDTEGGAEGSEQVSCPGEDNLRAGSKDDSNSVSWPMSQTPTNLSNESSHHRRHRWKMYIQHLVLALLTFCAGIVNVVAILSLGTYVSHTTATVTNVSVSISNGNSKDAGRGALLVFCFIFGSSICGLLIRQDSVNLGFRLYGIVMMLNSALLVLVMAVPPDVACYLAATACGLQNGMCNTYGNAVIRTTHVTGISTDIGVIIGRTLHLLFLKLWKGPDLQRRTDIISNLFKLRLLLMLFISYIAGTLVGAYAWQAVGIHALLLPAVISALVGVIHTAYRVFVLHQKLLFAAEIDEIHVSIRRASQLVKQLEERGVKAKLDLTLDSEGLERIDALFGGIERLDVHGGKRPPSLICRNESINIITPTTSSVCLTFNSPSFNLDGILGRVQSISPTGSVHPSPSFGAQVDGAGRESFRGSLTNLHSDSFSGSRSHKTNPWSQGFQAPNRSPNGSTSGNGPKTDAGRFSGKQCIQSLPELE